MKDASMLRRLFAAVLCLACANAPAFELRLTEEERKGCEAEGGCVVISRNLMARALQHAHDSGKATCEVDL